MEDEIDTSDIYEEGNVENFLDDDELSPEEEGFMQGYVGA